jgi:GNAT superfamily N-acetyltransferase
VSQFTSGKPPLDDWLKLTAHKAEGRTARTFVVCEGARVVGYYCLATGSVERKSAPGKLRKQAPAHLPVGILGRLAVDRSWQGKGLGSDLLRDAMARIVVASKTIGMRALLVHALDEESRMFYQSRAEFIEFPEDSRTLFLPLETIVDAL